MGRLSVLQRAIGPFKYQGKRPIPTRDPRIKEWLTDAVSKFPDSLLTLGNVGWRAAHRKSILLFGNKEVRVTVKVRITDGERYDATSKTKLPTRNITKNGLFNGTNPVGLEDGADGCA